MEDTIIKKHISYLKMAKIWSENSKCYKKKVGALIVKGNMIISDGYNGTPSGFLNDCEDAAGDTNWYVLHAEANAITKLAKSSQSSEGSTLYLTMSPCKECSKLIIQSGITKVIFIEKYRNTEGLTILKEAGVKIIQVAV